MKLKDRSDAITDFLPQSVAGVTGGIRNEIGTKMPVFATGFFMWL